MYGVLSTHMLQEKPSYKIHIFMSGVCPHIEFVCNCRVLIIFGIFYLSHHVNKNISYS